MIYLDNAATTNPKPPAVIHAVDNALKLFSANPGRGGHTPSIRAAEEVYRARANIAAFFNVGDEEKVIFTHNCTAALNTVINGVLKQGDHVVISSLEHNSVLRPLENLKRHGRITYSVAGIGKTDDETIESFRAAVNSHTRLFICTHASNVFGTVLPTSRLCALAHSYGILFCLDAAQSAGVLPIDLNRDRYDYVCCAGHKSLYGPMGTGLLLINCDVLPEPLIIGGTGSESSDSGMPLYLPDRLESGTLNVPGIIGLNAGLGFVRSIGVDEVYRRELKHIRTLYNALKMMPHIELYTPHPDRCIMAPVLSFTVGGMDSETAADKLNQRFGIAVRAGLHCAPLAHCSMGTEQRGTVRISPSVFTTSRDIQMTIKALNNFAQLS